METSNHIINLENESIDHNLNSTYITPDRKSSADTLYELNIRPRTYSGQKPPQPNTSHQHVKIPKPPNPGKRHRPHLSKQGSEYIRQSRRPSDIGQPFVTLEKTLYGMTAKMAKAKVEDEVSNMAEGVRTPVSKGTREGSRDSPGEIVRNSGCGKKLSNMARFCRLVVM